MDSMFESSYTTACPLWLWLAAEWSYGCSNGRMNVSNGHNVMADAVLFSFFVFRFLFCFCFRFLSFSFSFSFRFCFLVSLSFFIFDRYSFSFHFHFVNKRAHEKPSKGMRKNVKTRSATSCRKLCRSFCRRFIQFRQNCANNLLIRHFW